jgi:hypothetical protein
MHGNVKVKKKSYKVLGQIQSAKIRIYGCLFGIHITFQFFIVGVSWGQLLHLVTSYVQHLLTHSQAISSTFIL